jgi:predicted AlkP superfamily phosphohydrolase/phosphomutase
MGRKIVVIGLDGVDWRSLKPLIAAGYLPTLAQLAANGASGRLHSTIRPESSVAWATFATGVNAGQHGIFGFVRHQPNSYNFHLADSRHIQARRFWDYLGDAGYRVGLVNIPFTYPPEPVNGFLIGGMLTPGPHVSFTYPPELQQQLMERLPRPFLFDAGDTQDKQRLPEGVAAYTEQQLALSLLLLREEAWDCFVVVFTGPDRLQHFYWADFADDGRLSAETRPLLAHLQQLDAAIAQILTELPEETLLLLVSDHGFNGVGRCFFINHWLQEKGYLAIQGGAKSTDSLINWLTWLKRLPLARRIKQAIFPADWGVARWQTAVFTQPIDWSKTRAYYAPDGGLRLNQQGREPKGIVPLGDYEALRTELSQALLSLIDPQTGQRPIAQVYRREELYTGPLADCAPDLIVEPQREQPEPQHNYLLDSKLVGPYTSFGLATPYNGNHAPHGILLGWGQGIAPTTLPDSHLQDIAPTLLAAMDVPIPETMDGRPLLHLFAPDWQPQPRFVTEEPASPQVVETESDTDPDEALAKRLRNLGYLD